MKKKDHTLDWYRGTRPIYEGLTQQVCSIIKLLLTDKNINYLSVDGRTKSLSSLGDKITKKGYEDPIQEVKDFSGIRIITFLESDVAPVCDIIREAFTVDEENSLDKSQLLGSDKVGYRSVHFVCDLGEDRGKLPECTAYKGMPFEIQVRTALQHAWAEIEHDRHYKISAVLPPELERELYLIAGLLEKADRDFARLVFSMEKYRSSIRERTSSGDLDVEINTLSLIEYLTNKIKITGAEKDIFFSFDEKEWEVVISSLKDFGVQTLADLDRLLANDFLIMVSQVKNLTAPALLWAAMICSDADKFFDCAHKGIWRVIPVRWANFFKKEIGEEKFDMLIKKADIEII